METFGYPPVFPLTEEKAPEVERDVVPKDKSKGKKVYNIEAPYQLTQLKYSFVLTEQGSRQTRFSQISMANHAKP